MLGTLFPSGSHHGFSPKRERSGRSASAPFSRSRRNGIRCRAREISLVSWRKTNLAGARDVSVSAGKKKKVSPGGRLEGKRLPRDLGPSPEVINKVLAEADIVYNDDYYKYGAYGPYRNRGLVHGEPQFGDETDKDMVFLCSTVRDDEHLEAMDREQQCLIFNKKLDMMEADKVQFFYVFVRSCKRRKWLLPWKEWTLAANVAVESSEKLDKWEVGGRVDLRARHGVTRCVSWCRPDLIWVKRPSYQMRYEPQEDYILGLFRLLNPETEMDGAVGGDLEERSTRTFYAELCRRLGVEESASADEIMAAFDGLDENSRSLVLEHMINGQPFQFLYPFTKGWRRREAEAQALGKEVELDSRFLEEEEEESEDEDDDNQDEDSGGEDDEQDIDEEEDEEDEDDDDGEDENEDEGGEEGEGDYGEGDSDEDEEEDSEELDEFEDEAREQDQCSMQDGVSQEPAEKKKEKKRRKEDYFGGRGNPLKRPNLTTWQRDFYSEVVPSHAALRRYPRELYFHHFDHLDDNTDEEDNWNFEPRTGLKAAVRPFTYRDMLEEIVYIRRQFLLCAQEQ